MVPEKHLTTRRIQRDRFTVRVQGKSYVNIIYVFSEQKSRTQAKAVSLPCIPKAAAVFHKANEA